VNKYDRLFLLQARMGYSDFVRRYHRKSQYYDLHKRKHLLDLDFVFSEENIKRLSDINTLLSEKSEAAYQQAERLEKYVLNLMHNNDPFISDYEIEFKLCFFSEKKYSRIPDLQGNPIFEHEPIWFYKTEMGKEADEHKDWLFKTDHTELFHEGHPLNNFHHCYLFHDLIYHTILSYQDIVDIEDIWLEVVLKIQNFQDIPLQDSDKIRN
jgi:hypothetical protein